MATRIYDSPLELQVRGCLVDLCLGSNMSSQALEPLGPHNSLLIEAAVHSASRLREVLL